VSLDHLWAGWRSEYLDAGGPDPSPSSPAETSPAESAPAPASTSASTTASTTADDPAARCVFCRILSSGRGDEETNIVHRDPSGLAVAMLNAYPYATGHLMIMPVRHTSDLETLTPDEATVLWALVAQAVRAAKAAYHPDGLNVGINLGRAGGAGIPGHLHVHVVPRWDGDSNFMTSIAEARVLPEALSVTRVKLSEAWPAG
jgi:diadenosine tetraphosphate (Ap4A) HIT family hydrolase